MTRMSQNNFRGGYSCIVLSLKSFYGQDSRHSCSMFHSLGHRFQKSLAADIDMLQKKIDPHGKGCCRIRVFPDLHFGSFFPKKHVLDPQKIKARFLSDIYRINLKLIIFISGFAL